MSNANPQSERPADGEHLRAGAIGLPGVLMQAVALIAPAFAITVSFQFAVGQAGVAAPLVYLFAFFIVLMLAVTVSELARAFPSAGGFYTYVSRTVHPRVGFMCGWLLSLWLPPVGVLVLAFTGKVVLEPELQAQYGITLPWWVFVGLSLALVSVLVYRGVAISQGLLITLALLEILIVVALAIFAVASPGPGGFTLASFNPAASSSIQGLYLGVVFSVFAFTGWEGAAPLAEESEDPRRNVTRGTIGSVLILGAFLVFTSWAFLIGLGTGNIQSIINSTRSPTFILAENLWGGAWVIVLLALVNSAIAVCIASFNGSTRLWFGMGRSGVLPSSLARVHHRHQTPVNAIYLQIALSLVTFVLAALLGPEQLFIVWALAITFCLILVYVALNTGVLRYFYTEARDQFSPIKHGILPVLSTAAVLWVGYKSIVPFPEAPTSYAPIAAAIWFLLGVGLLILLKRRGQEDWLLEAGRAMEAADRPESDSQTLQDSEVGTES